MGIVNRVLRPRNTELITSEGLDRLLRGGRQAWSGINVTPNNAVQVSAVFACVRVIAEDIGKLPFVLYSRGSDDQPRQRAITSPFWRLIHDRPNPWQTSQAFRETLTAWAVLRGHGFGLKNIVGRQVRELLPLHPDRVRIEQLEDGTIIYHTRLADGREYPLTSREIFHLSGLSLDGVTGIGIVSLARQTIGTSLAAQRHAAKFFANGLQTSGVFKHPGQLSENAYTRLRESLKEDFSAEQVYSPMLLEEGMDWAQTGLTNKDSQFLESRQFDITEIARWFRVSPHKIADLTRATFSNIEHQAIEHVTDTLMPWGKRWEYAVNQQVIGTNNVYAELLFDGLLRGTTRDRYEAYQIAAGGNAPWMSRQEIRRLENLNPLPGLDEMLTPLNMGPVGGEEDGNDDAGAPDQGDA